MDPTLNTVCLVIISTMHVIGVISSAFIVAVNILDWTKGQTLSTCDLILVTGGIFSIAHQLTFAGHSYYSAIWWEGFTPGYKMTLLSLFFKWTGFSSCWITACLCVFYCVKIVDFNHAFFIWMKLRISTLMPWLLLGSVVGSLAFSVPTLWDLYGQSHQNSTVNIVFNSTDTDKELKYTLSYVRFRSLGICLPLLLGIISITLILASLIRHTRRMKENASDFSQPRLESHYAAARIMGSLLGVYFLILLFECFVLSSAQWWLIIARIMNTAQVPAHSTVLILGNSKLMQTLCKIFSPCCK